MAIHTNDMQYLVDLDIMRQENAEAFKFSFSEYNINPFMLACAIGK